MVLGFRVEHLSLTLEIFVPSQVAMISGGQREKFWQEFFSVLCSGGITVSRCMSLKVVFNACSSVLALEEGSHSHEQNSRSGWSWMSL
ncbi:unnamed protein product [Sphagnum tenellum]